MEGKFTILDTNQISEYITCLNSIFCAFRDFYGDFVDGKRQCLVGVYKNSKSHNRQMHWWAPNVHIFDTNESLVNKEECSYMGVMNQIFSF